MNTYIFSIMAAAVIFAIPLQLLGQITITSSDLLKPVGYTFAEESTGDGYYSVDLGSTGGPQTWDFTSYSTPYRSYLEVVDRDTTPFASDFPTSNLTIAVTREDSQEEEYQYMRVDSDLWSLQGIGLMLAESTFVQDFNPRYEIPLPVQMGSAWFQQAALTDTITGIVSSWVDRGHATVDAYGTMVVPMGQYPVLRAVLYDTIITVLDFPDPFPDIVDTSASIDYLWYGTGPGLVVQVESREGETNPDFTMAADIDRAASPTVIRGNGPATEIPHGFQLEQNAPNPFNPRTTITFSVPEGVDTEVELDVFTLRGEKVRTLYSGRGNPGKRTVSWDGADDNGYALPSGMYLYRLTSEGRSRTRKMILAK